MKKILFIVLLSFVSISSFALKPVPVDKVFSVTVKPIDSHTLVAHWKVAPGYHLYRERIKFAVVSPASAKLGTPIFPAGVNKEDDILGKYQVYEHDFDVTVPVVAGGKNLTVAVNYQGCADEGFCYPPTTKQIALNLLDTTSYAKAPTSSSATADATHISQDKFTQILANKNIFWILLAFLGFGVLLAFTPCVLPMIPILSSIIVGESKNINLKKAFWLSLTYVLAMAVTYACAGVAAGLAGGYVQAALQSPWVLASFSVLFVLLALSLFGFYELQMPSFLHQRVTEISNRQSGGNYVGVAVMGCLSTLIVSPCVTAPLIGALSYIGKTGDAVLGGSALFAMGIGMGVPLLVIGSVGGKFLPKAGAWMDAVKACFGVMMLGVAILLLSRVIPQQVTMMLWAGLLIMSSVYMGAFTATPAGGYGKLWKGFSVILLVYGFLLLIGASLGNTDPIQPLAMKQSSPMQLASNPSATSFKTIKSPADLKAALAEAKAQGKPVMIDFYADWCVSCKELDHSTFADPEVKSKLNKFVLLRADVTANDEANKALEKQLDVVAPPTIVFFDQQGNELAAARIVGALAAKEFLPYLEQAMS